MGIMMSRRRTRRLSDDKKAKKEQPKISTKQKAIEADAKQLGAQSKAKVSDVKNLI